MLWNHQKEKNRWNFVPRIYIFTFQVGMSVQHLYSWRAHPINLQNYYTETSAHKVRLKSGSTPQSNVLLKCPLNFKCQYFVTLRTSLIFLTTTSRQWKDLCIWCGPNIYNDSVWRETNSQVFPETYADWRVYRAWIWVRTSSPASHLSASGTVKRSANSTYLIIRFEKQCHFCVRKTNCVCFKMF